MGPYYSIEFISIETYAPQFIGHDKIFLGSVSTQWLKSENLIIFFPKLSHKAFLINHWSQDAIPSINLESSQPKVTVILYENRVPKRVGEAICTNVSKVSADAGLMCSEV